MGISRDHWHKRRKTGGKRRPIRKKRKFELGRPAANTKLGVKRVHIVRTRGGNKKFRALRLDHGNFSWASERVTRKTRVIDVVYNASNNELVRTKTLVKNCIVLIDATPFRLWYENHYALPLGKKKGAKLMKNKVYQSSEEFNSLNYITEAEEKLFNKKRSKRCEKKYKLRQKNAKVEGPLEEQFMTGRVLACVSSRPGQVGRCDGYILEGKELEFYLRKIKAKKGK
ncbi:40S ribosomal protein S8-like protein [Dinothrombium tinctorium]|uniref:40S ribosomal protein S8 n=1 Tax=Dinothrombium tinctorium TaxID=1965070 RepID=A0A3S3PJ45_9ACAR|nr:40S ribosomal protein S8-like protein [Dinothrombium tinctorium]